MKQDKNFMGVCLGLARLAIGRTSPNPMVGAVIVKKGKVVATGFHHHAGAPHAEIETIGNITKKMGGPRETFWSAKRSETETKSFPKGQDPSFLKEATLYVNLEPCCHQGRTPPCTDAIIRSGIREVVVGMKDPDPKVSGKGIRQLRAAGIKVRLLNDPDCESLNEAYLKHRRRGLPFVILKVAASLDGRVVSRPGESRWLTGKEVFNFVHSLRDEVDAILVGSKTVKIDNPRLTTRLPRSKGKDPIRIVVDSHLSVSPNARLFHLRSKAKSSVATLASLRKKAPAKVRQLTRLGVTLFFCRPNREGRVDLHDLLRQLGRKGIVSLLVEGGPTLLSSFIREKLADKFYLFLAPLLLGKGVPFLNNLKGFPILHEMTPRSLGKDVLIEGSF